MVVLLAATAAQDIPVKKVERGKILVRVDPRVELMSVIFRLAGNPEYNRGQVEAYTKAADAHFGRFKDHAVVRAARSLRRLRGVSYDACMSMAVHFADTDELREVVPLDPWPVGLDRRWTPTGARGFLKEAREFVREARFDRFLKTHDKLYQTAVERMQKVLDEHARQAWFDEFFGARPEARFELVLGMLNGGQCYGPRVRTADGKENLYCVLGVWSTDADGLPRFDRSMVETVVHEFCHSYCNPLVDKHADKLAEPAHKLYPHVQSAMRAQAYGNWKTVMYESLVRAAVVRYVRAVSGAQAARRQIAGDQQRSFYWVRELAGLLGQYEKQRDKYKTLDDFMPEVITFFETYAKRFEAQMAKAPKVVSMVPGNGARGVDPKLAEIKVTFDRPMRDQSWSVVGGGPNFPAPAGKVRYDAKRTTFIMPVRLKPNWRYELWLNSPRHTSFRSQDGVKLMPVKVVFWTGAGK
ncbi:MAG: DUF4932 domain-containing protein [Planctomycetota bacterium]|jgi:hypothetical protein